MTLLVKNLQFFVNKIIGDQYFVVFSLNIACRADQATCRNGQCIPRQTLCDGKSDCNDNSDEASCGGMMFFFFKANQN